MYAVQRSAAVFLSPAARVQDARKRRRTCGDGTGDISVRPDGPAAILARSEARERERKKPRTNPGRGSLETLGGAEEYAERQKQDEKNIGHAITSDVKTE